MFIALFASVLYVFRGALDLYFAQEDFRGLAVGTGLLPRHTQLWRYVSVQGFMDVFYPIFRDHAWPYHAVSLLLHVSNACLLWLLLSRVTGGAAALVGAIFFCTHPALFTALYWQSARADLLAGFFALCTVALSLRPGRERWLAVPSFALSLLSKESTFPLPVVVALLHFWLPSPAGVGKSSKLWRDPVLLLMSLMSLGLLAHLAGGKSSGIAIGFDKEAAYALDFGVPLFWNLVTYLGWTVDLPMLQPGLRFVDRQNPALLPLALVAAVISVGFCFWPQLRRRGFVVGLASYVALLIPVLPLRNHAYHYYLYVPLMAAAFCLATFVDTSAEAIASSASSKARPPTLARQRAFWALAAFLSLLLTWNGARLVQAMENRPSPVYPGLRGDAIVDRALIAERAIQSLRRAPIPPGAEMIFIMRQRIALLARISRGSGEEPPPPFEVYPERNVRNALFNGLGVRALIPAVDSVSFVPNVGPAGPNRRYAIYAPTGEVEVFDAAGLDSLLHSSWVTRW